MPLCVESFDVTALILSPTSTSPSPYCWCLSSVILTCHAGSNYTNAPRHTIPVSSLRHRNGVEKWEQIQLRNLRPGGTINFRDAGVSKTAMHKIGKWWNEKSTTLYDRHSGYILGGVAPYRTTLTRSTLSDTIDVEEIEALRRCGWSGGYTGWGREWCECME